MTFIRNAISPLAHWLSAKSQEGTSNNPATTSARSANPRSSFSLGTFRDKARASSSYVLFLNEAKELVFEADSAAAGSAANERLMDNRPLAYRARVELATSDDLEIVLREAGRELAVLTGNRSDLQLQTEEEVIALREIDKGLQILAPHTTYSWVVTTGLALCVCPQTQRPIARLQFRPFGRARLILINEGADMEPALFVTAAKLCFEHEVHKTFR